MAARESWGSYRHDGATSISWAWHEAPRQQVTSNVLVRLVSPGRFPKRVTLMLRPMPAAAAARMLESEVNAAAFREAYRRTQGRDATARDGPAAEQLKLEVRGRRLSATLALCSLVRCTGGVSNGEEVILGAAVDLLTDRKPRGRPPAGMSAAARRAADPTIPDVLKVVREGPDRLVAAAELDDAAAYRAETKDLRQTLALLCEGSLKGVFDGPTSHPIDLDAPAVSVDISAVAASGDTLVAAAMLSTWSYGFAMIDASTALAEAGLAPRRRYFAVMDELWRALRGSPGLVDHADALTRVYRGRDVAHAMATHSLDDLSALPSEEDRAKARGFVERNAITVLAGLPPRELEEVTRIVPLSGAEQAMVASWSAPESWQAGARHPGRGKYLIKTGQRVGIPVEMEYVGDEAWLYDTDSAVRPSVTPPAAQLLAQPPSAGSGPRAARS